MSDTLFQFFAGIFLVEAPMIFSWTIFLFAFGGSLFQNRGFLKSRISIFYSWLLGALTAFRFLISFFETVLQYYVWGKNPLTNLLLVQPLSERVPIPTLVRKIFFDNSRGYFLYYAWGHFFLNVLLSLFSALLFYFMLVFLRKYRERFFGEGEVILGTLMAFLVGWPNVVLFIPVALIAAVVFSLVRSVFWNKEYTRLKWPFFISGCGILAFGKFLIDLFRLGVLG